jgi:alpha-amylase
LLTRFSHAVYQGQEQHFSGGETPWNREALWTSGYNTSAELYVLASTLNKVRNNAISLSSSYVTSMASTLIADSNHLCLAKGPSGSQVVFCINNKSSSGDSYSLSVGGFNPSDAVVEVLSCTTSTADATGNVTMYMGAGAAKVYVLQSNLNGTGLCNTTTVASPSSTKNGAGSASFAGGLAVAVVMGWAMMFLA